jgi:FtsP/CotA-like multicopper oxidase with cupredoxin domain
MQFIVNNDSTGDGTGRYGANITNLTSLVLWNETIYDEQWINLTDMAHPDFVNDNILEDLMDKRELWVTERTQILSNPAVSSGARPLPMLGSRRFPFGLFYEQAITERILKNKPTIWEFLNLSADAHVIHLHEVRFRILDRRDVGLSYHTFQYPTGMYRQYRKNSV